MRSVSVLPVCNLCPQGKRLRIHEDPGGSIYVAAATTLKVESEEEVRGDGGGVFNELILDGQ